MTERPSREVAAISGALMRLAAATRDTTIDAAVVTVYISNLDGADVRDIVATCRKMESTESWFPKCAELVQACRKARLARQSEERRAWLEAQVVPELPEASEDTKASFLAKARRLLGAHVPGGGSDA